jgi:hypothetical protein
MGMLDWIGRLMGPASYESVRSAKAVDDGFQLLYRQEVEAEVRWEDVRRIVAYKYDLFACDEICLGFVTGEADRVQVEVSERHPGFLAVCEAMRQRFPSIPENWYNEIMVPAFERKETVLFEAGREPPA